MRRTRCLSPLAKLLSEPVVSTLLFCGGELHREIEETFFIPFCMALYEPDKLLCRRHFRAFTTFWAQDCLSRLSPLFSN